MCGIFGLFGRSLQFDDERSVLQALAHRGPDGGHVHRIGSDRMLGHTRLAIIDLTDNANQPMVGLDGRLVAVCNGEIYNVRELRQAIPDYPWITDHSDTETILAAYWRWGREFVTHLRGMFSFALWDNVDQSLFLAVDRFSIKPLLIAESSGVLAFASTAQALKAMGFPLKPNTRAVHSWLADGIIDTGIETFFEGITQVPAATLAEWRNGVLHTERYWAPPSSSPRVVNLDEITGWLDDAVQSHLLSDVPVGINLSSGLDSNLIRLRAKSLGHPLHSFSFGFPGTVYDEPARVSSLMSDDDQWTITSITPEEMWRDMIDVSRIMETPLGGVAIYGHYRNAVTANSLGYKVLMAGEGADEIFGGYKYYVEAAIIDLWKSGNQEAAYALYQQFSNRDPDSWNQTPEYLVRSLSQTMIARAPDGTALNRSFLTEAFSTSCKLPPVPAPLTESARAAMWNDLAYMKLPKLLRWQDRAYMAHGIEIRVPFLDHLLVEKMQAVPIAQLFENGHTKAPLRHLAESMMPSEYFRQPKLYVATPQREWLKKDLRTRIEEWLDPAALVVREGYIDLEKLRAAYRNYCNEDQLGNSFFIWKFLALEALFQGMFASSQAKVVR